MQDLIIGSICYISDKENCNFHISHKEKYTTQWKNIIFNNNVKIIYFNN